MITLRNGGAELDLLPEVGGAVSRFSIDGVDILRPAPPGTTDVLQTGCFPLVPFANRVADASFSFAGETVQLQRNFGDHPHALHGAGWRSSWRILLSSAHAATLVFEHAAGDWPWAYRALQTFSLSPRALHIDLEIANGATRAMPVSLGFHPYFERRPGTRLRADVAGVWLSDETCIPTLPSTASHFLDLANGALLADAPFVDHCHFGWKGVARIDQPELGQVIEMSASPSLGFLHCFVPATGGFFCAEPVSAMPDPFVRPAAHSGLRIVAPREKFAVSMTLTLRAR